MAQQQSRLYYANLLDANGNVKAQKWLGLTWALGGINKDGTPRAGILAKLEKAGKAKFLRNGFQWYTFGLTKAEIEHIFSEFDRLVMRGPVTQRQQQAYAELHAGGFVEEPPSAAFYKAHTYGSLSDLIADGRALEGIAEQQGFEASLTA
jgi:hypothetical protein